MAKITLAKLGLKKPNIAEEKVLFNEQEITVKQYLPINDKLTLVSEVLNENFDSEIRFYNTGKIDVSTYLWIIRAYTNISFSDKQEEDPAGTYDLLVTSGLLKTILDMIPEKEINYIKFLVIETISAIYKYQNSAMGVLQNLSQDYENLKLDTNEITDKLTNPKNLTTLKEIVSKLG